MTTTTQATGPAIVHAPGERALRHAAGCADPTHTAVRIGGRSGDRIRACRACRAWFVIEYADPTVRRRPQAQAPATPPAQPWPAGLRAPKAAPEVEAEFAPKAAPEVEAQDVAPEAEAPEVAAPAPARARYACAEHGTGVNWRGTNCERCRQESQARAEERARRRAAEALARAERAEARANRPKKQSRQAKRTNSDRRSNRP